MTVKTNMVSKHDYITVTVKDELTRLNFTVSWGGNKVSGSTKADAAKFNALFADKQGVISKFARGRNAYATPLAWITAVKEAGEVAASIDDFIAKLPAKLEAVNAAAVK